MHEYLKDYKDKEDPTKTEEEQDEERHEKMMKYNHWLLDDKFNVP